MGGRKPVIHDRGDAGPSPRFFSRSPETMEKNKERGRKAAGQEG